MRDNALRFVEIRTHDLVRSERFYRAVFAWILTRPAAGVPAATINGDDGPVGVLLQVPSNVPRTVCPYVAIDDCAAAARRAVQRGAALLIDRELAGDSAWFSLTLDPWGNHLALWEQHEPQVASVEGGQSPSGAPEEGRGPGHEEGAVSEGSPFVWLELHTPQLDEAMDYYASVTGWKLQRIERGPRGVPAADGLAAQVTLESAELQAGHGSLVYIEVSDLAQVAAEIAKMGGTVLARFDHGPRGRPALVFADPDDNALAAVEA